MEQFSMFNDIKQISNDWKWSFKDYPSKNGLKVFSFFACGGGSTMGYKLCGCEVIGCNEIDPKINKVYVANHNPKYNYCEDIRDFNKREDLPEELYDLDILDCSPPCSTFSVAGKREEGWGKEKKFREGQKLQTLDDLVFISIESVAKLRPKVAIMENVEGLTLGKAWKYVQEIYKRFNDIGYKVKHWLVKGETIGLPQTRHRVFFVATRLDFDLNNINMYFNYEEVLYKNIKTGKGEIVRDKLLKLLEYVKPPENDFEKACVRMLGKPSLFNTEIVYDNSVLKTVTSTTIAESVVYDTKCYTSNEDIIHSSTFPEDFNFIDFNRKNIRYICGMSVPPLMMKRVVTRLIESGLFDYKLKEN